MLVRFPKLNKHRENPQSSRQNKAYLALSHQLQAHPTAPSLALELPYSQQSPVIPKMLAFCALTRAVSEVHERQVWVVIAECGQEAELR